MSATADGHAQQFLHVLDSILQQLDTPDKAKIATTCAALAMLVARTPADAIPIVSKVLPEANRLLQVDDVLVQVNLTTTRGHASVAA